MKIIDSIAIKRNCEKYFHFISFDIPEGMKNERDKFRDLIKRLGFIQIQRSLWVTNQKVGDLVEMSAYECGVEKYVIYILSQKTDIDGIINKMLKKIK
jgi:CRISPR-associated endonuclease Cas2